MFEASTHWGRGLWIIVGMVGTVVAFLVILQLLPKPGTGNPLDSLTASSNTAASTPTVAAAGAASSPVLQTVTAQSTRGPSSTGTPGPRWAAVAAGGRAPNVRSAPSTNNNPIGTLAPARQVEVLGRSADNAWLQIVWDANQKAWVAADLMTVVTGDRAQLPVVQ
jgi:uncharacterized protein YgiM (DUF1202 family)